MTVWLREAERLSTPVRGLLGAAATPVTALSAHASLHVPSCYLLSLYLSSFSLLKSTPIIFAFLMVSLKFTFIYSFVCVPLAFHWSLSKSVKPLFLCYLFVKCSEQGPKSIFLCALCSGEGCRSERSNRPAGRSCSSPLSVLCR